MFLLFFVNNFLINTFDLSGNIVPLDAVHLIISATCCKSRDCRIVKKAVNGISHCIDIPEINLECIVENLGTT